MEDKIRVLLTEEEVNEKIKKIGEQVSKDYAGKSVHMICVLKGGVFFTCELAKRITVPVSLDFMSVSSYGSETKSSGIVKIIKDLDEPLEGKEVPGKHPSVHASGQTGTQSDRCKGRLCWFQHSG